MFSSRRTLFRFVTRRQLSHECESAAQGTDLDQGIEILETELRTNPMNGEWSSLTATMHTLISSRGKHADER